MFNPYHARPIGSESFERHLLTLMIQNHEEDDMKKEILPGFRFTMDIHYSDTPVKYDPISEGYKALETAIFARALADYLYEYAWYLKCDLDMSPNSIVHYSRCLTMENQFFRTDPDKEELFDYILQHICHKDFIFRTGSGLFEALRIRLSARYKRILQTPLWKEMAP